MNVCSFFLTGTAECCLREYAFTLLGPQRVSYFILCRPYITVADICEGAFASILGRSTSTPSPFRFFLFSRNHDDHFDVEARTVAKGNTTLFHTILTLLDTFTAMAPEQ